MSSFSQRSLTHLGMDVHKDSISVGILRPNKIACALLGLEPVVEERYGSTHKDYRAPLATAAGGQPRFFASP